MSVINMLIAAHASPVVLSEQAEQVHATVSALTADQCSPVLEGYFAQVRQLTPAQVDMKDAAANGPATMQRLSPNFASCG